MPAGVSKRLYKEDSCCLFFCYKKNNNEELIGNPICANLSIVLSFSIFLGLPMDRFEPNVTATAGKMLRALSAS
ncbi:unnamed protein product [Boreogadus saida]